MATRGNEKPTPLSLTREQCAAIQIAEQFVLENGYTSAPAAEDRSRIALELADDPSRIDRVLRMRHDSLKPHAYGLYSGGPEDPLAWMVIFEYTDRVIALVTRIEGKPREDPGGAAVLVKMDAGRLRAAKQHMDMRLIGLPRLPSHEAVSTFCRTMERSP